METEKIIGKRSREQRGIYIEGEKNNKRWTKTEILQKVTDGRKKAQDNTEKT